MHSSLIRKLIVQPAICIALHSVARTMLPVAQLCTADRRPVCQGPKVWYRQTCHTLQVLDHGFQGGVQLALQAERVCGQSEGSLQECRPESCLLLQEGSPMVSELGTSTAAVLYGLLAKFTLQAGTPIVWESGILRRNSVT